MNKEQLMVREFHEKFGLTINDKPIIVSTEDRRLRQNLIEEESREFIYSDAEDLLSKLDALADLLYVVYGAGITYGFDLEKAFEEVHRSNMTKLWKLSELNTDPELSVWCVGDLELDSRCYLVKRKSDGKVIKSPSYSLANLKQFLQ